MKFNTPTEARKAVAAQPLLSQPYRAMLEVVLREWEEQQASRLAEQRARVKAELDEEIYKMWRSGR